MVDLSIKHGVTGCFFFLFLGIKREQHILWGYFLLMVNGDIMRMTAGYSNQLISGERSCQELWQLVVNENFHALGTHPKD